MFGFSDSNNSYNSSSSSNSNTIFNNKILFINFNNIIKTESSKPSKPKSAKPSKPKSDKPKSAKPKSAKSNNAVSSNPNNAVSSNPASANTRIIYGDVLNKLRIIFDEYINKKYSETTTNRIECKPFFDYISSQIDKNKNFNFMSRQNLMKQQDTGELIIEFINYINMYSGSNMQSSLSEKSNFEAVDIINSILAFNLVYNNILYYLFGIIFTNKVDKITRNNNKISTYTYDLQYILEIKLHNPSLIYFNNINDLFKDYNSILSKSVAVNVAQNNAETIKNTHNQYLQPIICGKYVIISLIHEKNITKNSSTTLYKIPIIIKNITTDLIINGKRYEFIGASEHIGQTIKSGHYVSYIKKKHNNNVNYYLYDDENVTKITDMNILKNNKNKTYRILIYKCKDDSFYMNDSDNTKPIKKLFNNNASKINDIIQKVNTKLIGSINYRNTCYFNSLLVLLMHIPEFVYLILNYDTIPTLLTSINNR